MKYYIKKLIYNVPFAFHKVFNREEHLDKITTTCSITIGFTDFNTDYEKVVLGDVYYYENNDFKNLKIIRIDETGTFAKSEILQSLLMRIKHQFHFELNELQLLKLKRKGWLQTGKDNKTRNDFAIYDLTYLTYPDKLSVNEYLELKSIYQYIKSFGKHPYLSWYRQYFFMGSLSEYYLNNCDYQTNIDFINKINKAMKL